MNLEQAKEIVIGDVFPDWEWQSTTIQELGIPKMGGAAVGLQQNPSGEVIKVELVVVLARDNLMLAARNGRLLLWIFSRFVNWDNTKAEKWLSGVMNKAAKVPVTFGEQIKHDGWLITFRADKRASQATLTLERKK